MQIKKYFAEFVGTFLLTLAVSIAIKGGSPLPVPVIAGLALGIGVYFMGTISGAHFNPAITIALASIKKLEWKTAWYYIGSQILGAALAILVIKFLFVQTVDLNNDNAAPIFLVEALAAFVLALGVSTVVQRKVKDEMAGIIIGGSLLLGLMLTTAISPGIGNPAVAIGLKALSLTYIAAPIVGAVAAVFLYEWISSK